MRKILIGIITVLILGFGYLAFFNAEDTEIKLPNPEKIVEIKMIDVSKNEIKYEDPEEITRIVEDFSTKIKTEKTSISGTPHIDDWVKITFVQQSKEESIAYIYEDEGVYYIEQPYVGVWILEKNPESWIYGHEYEKTP